MTEIHHKVVVGPYDVTMISRGYIDTGFKLRVREMCRSCKRYGLKATCPPHVDSVAYWNKLLKDFNKVKIFYKKFYVNEASEGLPLGVESSLEIHKTILKARQQLFDEGIVFAVGFGAGSCKLCPECQFPCNKPAESLTPLEATGMDIVTLMKEHDIEIKFPIVDHFYRVGALFHE